MELVWLLLPQYLVMHCLCNLFFLFGEMLRYENFVFNKPWARFLVLRVFLKACMTQYLVDTGFILRSNAIMNYVKVLYINYLIISYCQLFNSQVDRLR